MMVNPKYSAALSRGRRCLRREDRRAVGRWYTIPDTRCLRQGHKGRADDRSGGGAGLVYGFNSSAS